LLGFILTDEKFLDKIPPVAYISLETLKSMRKEVLFAILAGGIFGLVVAFGVWRLNSTVKEGESAQTSASPTPSAKSGVTVAKPLEKQVITDSSVEISGITKPESFVVISTPAKDFFGISDSNGEFKIKTDLEGGINKIKISVLENQDVIAQTDLTLVYSSQMSQGDTTNEEASEGDEVREKVQQKVKEAQNIPLAYMGSITDISETTLQIKDVNDEIKQVMVGDTTTYVNDVSTSKTITFEEVAIGDFILAMGYKNGNEVLQAQRIVVTSEPQDNSPEIYIGKFKSYEGKTATITLSSGEEKEASFGKTWKGPELSELEEGETVIVVLTKESGKLTARSIQQTSLLSTPSPESTPSEEPTKEPSPSPTTNE